MDLSAAAPPARTRPQPVRRARRLALLAGLAALVCAACAAGWWLRPMAGAGSFTNGSLCGAVVAGSADDSVEEQGAGISAGEPLALAFGSVNPFGHFAGTLSCGRFGTGVPVAGWLRARGFSASYRTPALVRGRMAGQFHGAMLRGSCTERFKETAGGEPRTITTTFGFRLERCAPGEYPAP